jgi:autotransporter-associated beta strand protein
MKNRLLFNLSTPFATSKLEGKTFRNLIALVMVVLGMGFSWGQTNISLEGFETVASTPSFGFTISGGGYTTGSTASTSSAPLSSPLYSGGARGYGANNTTTTITSGNISTIGYSSVALSLKLGSFSITSTGNGADSSDFVKVEVSPNGGTNYYILLWQVGSGNLTWAFGNSSTYTNTYSTSALTTSGNNIAAQNLTITGLPNTTNLRVRITMFNTDAAELWAIDDVKITGTLSCTSPTTQTTSLTANTITTTSSNYAFTRGNGDNVLVVARLNGTSSVAPTSGTTYTPSSTGSFTGTTTTGTGNIVVYNGAAAGASTASGNLNLTNLTAGSYYTLTAYEYATTGTCYNTTSPASVNFYTLCEAPISTTPSTVGSKSFTASWGAVSGASSYKLDVSTDNGFSSFVGIYNDLTVASTSQAITGLNYNTAYYFRVRAINTNNVASADSNISSITTKTVATSLVLVGAPSTANVGVNLTSFTVEARRNDATVDDAYTSSISITKASGSGTISGNSAVAASSGTVTFASIQFNAADTYTISATDGTLTSSASSDIVVSLVNTTTTLWNGSSSTWLTAGNWDNGIPTSTKVAQFSTAAQTTVGINMNGITTGQRTIAAVEFLSGAIARTINNSSTTVANNIILSGGVVNGIMNVILRNNSNNLMTIADGSSRTLGIELVNATDNLVNIDGSGGITISCGISGSNPLTKAGSGTGVLTLTGANTFTGLTTVSAGTLRLNKSGGTTIPTTNSVTVSGGILQISTDQTLANLTLTSGTVIIDAGITLTITGTISRTSGVIRSSSTSNLIITGTSGTIAFDQTTPGTTNVLKNLTITGSGTTTLANALNITAGSSSGVVTVGTGATLNTGGFLTFKSDANGTASFGNSAGTISVNVTV